MCMSYVRVGERFKGCPQAPVGLARNHMNATEYLRLLRAQEECREKVRERERQEMAARRSDARALRNARRRERYATDPAYRHRRSIAPMSDAGLMREKWEREQRGE